MTQPRKTMNGNQPERPRDAFTTLDLSQEKLRKTESGSEAHAAEANDGWCSWCNRRATDWCQGHNTERWFLAVSDDGRIQRWKDGTPILHDSAQEALRYSGRKGEVRAVDLELVKEGE